MDPASDLFVFREIARLGSFVAASRLLGMTPSGISKRLSRFEQRLQIRLFNRTTRKLVLTEAGESLYWRAVDILDAIEDAENSARELAQTPSGRLNVACSDAFALHVVIPLLSSFSKAYPQVTVSLIQGDGPQDLLAEQIDLAIRFDRPSNAGFVTKQLVPDPWVICASPNYLLQHPPPQTPEALKNHRCLTIRARQKHDDIWEFGHRHNATHVTKVTLDSVFSGIGLVVKAAALNGLGIARLARFLVSEEIRNGQLVEILEDYPPAAERHIYAVYPNREYLPQKVRVFIDALQVHLQNTAAKSQTTDLPS